MEDRIESDLEQYVIELSKVDEGKTLKQSISIQTLVNQKKNLKIYKKIEEKINEHWQFL